MKGQFLYLVINLLALFSVSYQISVLSEQHTQLYKMDEQIIKITFDSEISVSKVNAVITRGSVTSITGDCTEIKTDKKIANCSFDLTSVTEDLDYELKIKYDNIDVTTITNINVKSVFACYPFVNYLEKEKDQNTVILCNKEVSYTTAIVKFVNSTTSIQGVCTKYKEDARKLNCTFDCSKVSGGYTYDLKVTYDSKTNNNKNAQLTIGKSNAFRLKITSQLLIILLVILF